SAHAGMLSAPDRRQGLRSASFRGTMRSAPFDSCDTILQSSVSSLLSIGVRFLLLSAGRRVCISERLCFCLVTVHPAELLLCLFRFPDVLSAFIYITFENRKVLRKNKKKSNLYFSSFSAIIPYAA